jgi:hypothetical protein
MYMSPAKFLIVAPSRRLAIVLTASIVALAAACANDATSPSLPVGTYRLERIDLNSLPTPEPCPSGLTILSGHVVLSAHGQVSVFQRDLDVTIIGQLKYNAQGTYFQRGDTLLLNLAGQWSDDRTVYPRLMKLVVNGDELLLQGLGAPCDGNSTAHYELVAP